MDETNAFRSTTRMPNSRGAATPSKDGVHRVGVPLRICLSASELIRVLLVGSGEMGLDALTPVGIRSLIADMLTRHGYDVLAGTTYDPCFDRHQDARRAIRRAYGRRFLDAPDEQTVLASLLLEVLSPRAEGDES